MPVFSKGCSDVLYNHDITMISQNSVTFYMYMYEAQRFVH